MNWPATPKRIWHQCQSLVSYVLRTLGPSSPLDEILSLMRKYCQISKGNMTDKGKPDKHPEENVQLEAVYCARPLRLTAGPLH